METIENFLTIKTCLISVSDKTGLEILAKKLMSFGVEIIATGGTGQYLNDHQIKFTPIEEITGNPEAFQGRMKTISFQIGSGLLYRRDHDGDREEAAFLKIPKIDLVICNVYPFAEQKKKNGDLDELIEKIDVGGPTMIRAGAKNFLSVGVLTSVNQYAEFLHEIDSHQGKMSLSLRKKLSVAAFGLTAHYDKMIYQTLNEELLLYKSEKELRYGENPHQQAKLLIDYSVPTPNLSRAPVLQGRELSYNNFVDADAAWRITSDLYHIDKSLHAVSIIKHTNPCGAALGRNQLESLQAAWNGDPISSFGSIICFSSPLESESALWLQDKFIEVLIAPEIDSHTLSILKEKKNLRVIVLPPRSEKLGEMMMRSISGGFLLQNEDEGFDETWECPTQLKFPPEKQSLVHFGTMVAKHLKSNALALVEFNSEMNRYFLLSSGMGQPNRLDALKNLVHHLQPLDLSQSVLISDAFFPFADSIHYASESGIGYIVQPGGSLRDPEVIAACDELGISMLLTKRRHFRH